MILCLRYDDLEGNAVKGVIDGKEQNFYLRVEVDESNIKEAVERLRGSKWLVGFDYVGDISFLNGIDLSGVTVMVKVEAENSLDIDFAMKMMPKNMRMIVKLKDDFSDMRMLYDISQKYKNIRFCGGYLLKLDGVPVGCIGVEDINKKIPEKKISIIADKCGCVMKMVTLDDLEEVEFYNDNSLVKKGTGPGVRKKTVKRQLSSLVELSKIGGIDNF